MMKQLAHTHVLITRTEKQAAPLIKKIESLGGKITLFPCIEISPPNDFATLQQFQENMCEYDIAIFTSGNATQPINFSWPKNKTIAIGAGTAKAMRNKKIPVTFISKKFSSEGLLALDVLQNVQDKKIAIFCGENPRPLLAEALSNKGAHVFKVFCYRRALPRYSNEAIQNILKQNITHVLCLSMETLKNLFILTSAFDKKWLSSKQLIVATQSMAKLATKELNLKHPAIVLNTIDEASIINALKLE